MARPTSVGHSSTYNRSGEHWHFLITVLHRHPGIVYRQRSPSVPCSWPSQHLSNTVRRITEPPGRTAFKWWGVWDQQKAPILHNYHIDNSSLQRVEELRDLGITLDSKLTFSAHINRTVSKANRALGILRRSFQSGLARQKFDRKALLSAYYANVRSVLEYGTIVWSGAAKTHLKRLERVQHKFLIWLATRARGTNGLTSLEYRDLLSFFNVQSLEARRAQFDLMYLRNIFSGRIDSSFLLGCFQLHVPRRPTRNVSLFSEPFARVASVKTGMFTRLAKEANDFIRQNPQVDFFSDTFNTFKTSVVAHVTRAPRV